MAGRQLANVNLLAVGLFGLGCLAIAALIVLAPRRPRFGAVMFLVMAAFLLTNKVYSPQYMLWLLPFVVLARPVWRDWLIFTAGELFYFVAIWWHLGGLLAPGAGGADRVYWLAVLLRMATQTWIVIMVVRDAWRPEHDVVRRGGTEAGIEVGHDDPTGGVLDGAPDAGWFECPASVDPSMTTATLPRLQANRGRTVAQAWVASRGLIMLVALLIDHHAGQEFARVVSQWDVEHFTDLAVGGYLYRADGTLMAFFPGLPMLLRFGLWVGLPVAVTGVIAGGPRFGGGGRRPAPARWSLGGGGLVVRPHGGVHPGALHGGAVLRGRLLGLGTGPRRSLGRRRPAGRGRVHDPGLRPVPGRGAVRPAS